MMLLAPIAIAPHVVKALRIIGRPKHRHCIGQGSVPSAAAFDTQRRQRSTHARISAARRFVHRR